MMAEGAPSATVKFHHVQLYADELQPLEVYTACQDRLLKLKGITEPSKRSTSERRTVWAATGDALDPASFTPPGQDVVDQMIHGLGWRITGQCEGDGTRSYLVTSEDPTGIKFIVSAKLPCSEPASKRVKQDVTYAHFNSANIDRFYEHQAGRQGCAVLAFEVTSGNVASIEKRYRAKHPALLPPNAVAEYDGFKILEVFAYYKGEIGASDVDRGTMLRFVEKTETASQQFLPGIEEVKSVFDGTSCGAYFDHWVSNVVSRTGFLQTLEDTLDFSIKVDFNAGVVAAGRAQIESTVTGNSSSFQTDDAEKSLVDQSQVYLPINNALSEVGHVHFYLDQIGQGIQHLASRVKNLTWFIARVNAYREITGKGFTFLNIPPSYYGRLVTKDFTQHAIAPISEALATSLLSALKDKGLVDGVGIVKLSATREDVESVREVLPDNLQAEYDANADNIGATVVRGIYSNMYKLLRDNLSEEQYLDIVRNKILVDIQDGDILYQIFTCTVLQRKTEDEAPFLEFIQRVCSNRKNSDGSSKPIAPGCGGFGIRNFLTLFLSIEVSKAMSDLRSASNGGDAKGVALAEKKIDIFTSQLDKANPILTNISDAMTEEGAAKADFERATTDVARTEAKKRLEAAKSLKKENNAALQANSKLHSDWMLRVVNGEE